MSSQNLFYFMAIIAPIFMALSCLILVILTVCPNKKDKCYICKPIIGFFVCVISNWTAVTFYQYVPDISIYIYPLFFMTSLLEAIFLYHFAFIVTREKKTDKFPALYYIVPISLCLIFAVWSSIFIPLDVITEVIGKQGQPLESYPVYSAFFNSVTHIRGLICVYCMVMVLIRLYTFRKKVLDFLANDDFASLRWVGSLALVAIAVLLIPIGFAVFDNNRGDLYHSPLLFIMSALVGFQLISLTANLINDNYMLMSDILEEDAGCEEKQDENAGSLIDESPHQIDKKEFETYIKRYKPYLNPNLKITDLTKPLQTNRTYLSSFINQTYGMNFCRYINIYRLKEYEKLIADPNYRHHSKAEVACKAGFSNYQNYLRAKKREDDENV